MEEIDDIIAAAEEEAPEIPDEEENVFSWTLEDGAAVKQADRHAFLYRETIVPPEIGEYFGAPGLLPGTKKRIVLWHGDARYDAFIEKTRHPVPKTRMIWRQEFAAVLAQEYPQWLEYFRKSRTETGDTPSIRFFKKETAGHFGVDLEGVRPEKAAGEFRVPLAPGDTVDNDTIRAVFRCSLLGPMRWSPATNSLVLVSDHTQPGNEDQWIGKVFHFTGMGTVDDQGPLTRHNRTLAGSRESGARLFLFEVFEPGKYVFIGEAGLMDSPYRSRQAGTGAGARDVWVFPLQLAGHKNPPLIEQEVPGAAGEPARKRVRVISHNKAGAPGEFTQGKTTADSPSADLLEPDRIVSEYARRSANGLCQLCGMPAPFAGNDGMPYLEIHHIIPLREGGADSIGNVAALCPNCHRKMHVLNLQADVQKLKDRIAPRA